MNPDLIHLIEDNGLTLHGDIEHFAHLIEEREREACCKALEELHRLARGAHNHYLYAAHVIRGEV